MVKARERTLKIEKLMQSASDEAKTVLERCETAYAASTSVGLAAAFGERADSLSKSIWLWTAGLLAALVVGGFFGFNQLQLLLEAIREPSSSGSVMAVNVFLAGISVGPPVWFAWLSTKQIGQRFRLAEDYAFKASVARAYEGFRREAARVDKSMEADLLASALRRLDELPLRLVEAQSYGTPWHELAQSDVVKRAFKEVSDFPEKIRDFASRELNARTSSKKSSNTTPPADRANEQ